MASRQAGFFVKHTEKIVLLAALAFAVLVVTIAWAGVFGSPSATQVGPDSVTPGTVEQVVGAEADRLRRALDAEEPGVPDVTIPPYSEEFAARIATPVLPADQLALAAPIGPGGLTERDFVARDTNYPTYRLPSPPPVDNAVVKAATAVLEEPGAIGDAQERQSVVQLANNLALPPGQPGDFQYVSVMGRFPLGQWVERLEAPDPDRELQPIPRNVWQPRLGLASVYPAAPAAGPDDRAVARSRAGPHPARAGRLPAGPARRGRGFDAGREHGRLPLRRAGPGGAGALPAHQAPAVDPTGRARPRLHGRGAAAPRAAGEGDRQHPAPAGSAG